MNRKTAGALAAIVVIAAAVRFWALSFGLPHTNARPDENAVIGTAIYFLRGDLQPRFYDYPWLQMYVVTALDLVYFAWGRVVGWFASYPAFVDSWPVHWEPFYLIARGLTATLGTATILVVFWIAKRLWGEATGLVAALFLALAYIHVRDSHYATTDVPMTFLTILAVAYLVDAHIRRRPPIGGAFVSGLATATKYGAVMMGAPLGISYLAHVAKSRDGRLRALVGRHLWAVSLAFLVALAVGIPFVVFDNARFMDAMKLLQQSMVQGQGQVPTESGWIRHLTVSLRYGIGVPLLAAGLGGIIGIAVQTPIVGALLFAFPAVYFAVAASFNNLFFRYMIPVVPFLCLSAAWLVTWTVNRVLPDSSPRPAARAALTAVAAVALLIPSAISVWNVDRLLGRDDNRVVLARWFAQHVPERSSVVQSGSMYGHAQFAEGLHYTQWIWNKSSELFEVDRREAQGMPDWIVIQDSPLPSDTQPILERFIRDGGYTLVQRFAALTLPGDRVYDTQDAFFVPFARFEGVRRPGPNFAVYRHDGAPMR